MSIEMAKRLARVSKSQNLPMARATFYKWHHLGKYPGLFVKLGGALFVDLDALDNVIEEGRQG